MTEEQAAIDLRNRGIWRLAPGLWCDSAVPDLILVEPEVDTARDVLRALAKEGTE